jgi:hypothetical protein
MTRSGTWRLGAALVLTTAACDGTARYSQPSPSPTQDVVAAAQDAWQAHPMGRCLAGKGWSAVPVVTTKQQHEAVSSTAFTARGPIVSVRSADGRQTYSAAWLGLSGFEQTVAAPDTPANRAVSLAPLQRLGCDPERLGIDVVWEPTS